MNSQINEQNKWYLEEKCRYGKDCRGWKSGACPYNHQGLRGTIRTKSKIPRGFCKYENPKEGKRCRRLRCFCDHLKGRVEFVERKQQRHKIGPKYADTSAAVAAIAAIVAVANEGSGSDDDVDTIEAPQTPDRPTRPVSPRAPPRPVRLTTPITTTAVGSHVRVLPPPLLED